MYVQTVFTEDRPQQGRPYHSQLDMSPREEGKMEERNNRRREQREREEDGANRKMANVEEVGAQRAQQRKEEKAKEPYSFSS